MAKWIYGDTEFDVIIDDEKVGLDEREFTEYLNRAAPLPERCTDENFTKYVEAQSARDMCIESIFIAFEIEVPALLGIKLKSCLTDCGEPCYYIKQ